MFVVAKINTGINISTSSSEDVRIRAGKTGTSESLERPHTATQKVIKSI